MITIGVNRRPSPMDNEQMLVAQAQSGDRNAFGELVLLHRAGVINVVYRLCGDAELAEDAAQDAFIKAWKNLHRYQPKSPFRNWIYRIAVNTALDVVRRQRPTVEIDDLPLPSNRPGPETLNEIQDQAETIQRMVLALPAASRIVIILREYEGLSYKEIAEALEIPLGTVMSRLNYARNQLRQSLAQLVEVA